MGPWVAPKGHKGMREKETIREVPKLEVAN